MKCGSLIIALVLVQGLSSCSVDNPKVESLPAAVVEKPEKTGALPSQPKHLYLQHDSICVLIDKKMFCIKNDASINYKNSYAGIYEIHGDSIKKSYSLVLNNLIYFTTYGDGIGHKGYLYVFDPSKKTLVKEMEFKHNYLYSFWGMFIIDRKTNKIFNVNPGWYDEQTVAIVAASMYSIKGGHFKLHKLVYDRLDHIQQDTTIIRFYHKSLADNGKHGLLFPKKGWK